MGVINKYLYDSLDREYERKNLYLKELALLQEEIKNASDSEKKNLKNQLNELIKNKANHKYNVALNDFKNKEKVFLNNLEEKLKKLEVKGTYSEKVKGLEIRLERAKQKKNFYSKYVNLTYDAEIIYEQSKLEIEQIPSIIEFANRSKSDLDKATAKLAKINLEDEKRFQEELKKFKINEKEFSRKAIKELKEKSKQGIISLKAKEEGIKTIKRKYKEKVSVKFYESEKNFNKEIVNNKKYELSRALKQKIRTVDINVADLRRNYPIEIEKTTPWIAYSTFLFPGLGQLFNKQYIKSIIMFLATIYIYLIAIPYSLGFGNYMGDGIAGLVTLGLNGGRLNRSITFMIEGLIAVAFLSIAIVLMILVFKDAYTVEKDKIKGIRVRSWCETRETLLEDGFPYLVSLPALVIIVFIVFIPIATTILLSFTGMDPNSQAKFGWESIQNYKMLATGQGMVGSIFWKILRWTIVWTLGSTTLGIGLGFVLALVLNNDRIKGKTFFRSIYLLPWAVPAFITILFFSILSSPKGAITVMLQGIFGSAFAIKSNATVTKIVLICIQGWLGSSYVFLLATGVLQSISKDLYEAADIDGATTFSKLSKITIPMVLFQTAPLLVGQYTFNFNNFSNIYLFNTGGPFNPAEYGNLAGQTDILISYIYKLTIENQEQAFGAAITIMISIALMIVAYMGFRNTHAFRKEK